MGRILSGGAALVVAATAVVAVLSGCSSGGGKPSGTSPSPKPTVTSTQTVTRQPSPPPTAPSSRPPPPQPAPDAGSTVQAYVDAINAHDYARAWDLGGKNLGGSFSSFRQGFTDTVTDVVQILDVHGETVTVNLESLQTDGTVRSFAGTYTVRGGVIVAANIHEVGSQPPGTEGPKNYKNCAEARADHNAPIRKGEPGYAPHLDRDKDGIACERFEGKP